MLEIVFALIILGIFSKFAIKGVETTGKLVETTVDVMTKTTEKTLSQLLEEEKNEKRNNDSGSNKNN